MDARTKFQKLEQVSPVKIWRGRVVMKNEVWLFRFISWFFNLFGKGASQFMDGCWTTIPMGVFRPTVIISAPNKYRLEHLEQWWTLGHELVHGLQAKRWTPVLFNWLYLWPLSQGGLIVVTCWLPVFWSSGWRLAVWICCWAVVGGLHFIPKLPDPWRARWELEAYCLSMFFYKQQNGGIPDYYVERLTDLFCDMSYFQMAASRKRMRARLFAEREKIERGTHKVKDSEIVRLLDRIDRGEV